MKNPIILFAYFALNYNYDFIERVWEGDQHMINHLNSKFNSFYGEVGSSGVMVRFFVNLDNENQEMLSNWIVANYPG